MIYKLGVKNCCFDIVNSSKLAKSVAIEMLPLLQMLDRYLRQHQRRPMVTTAIKCHNPCSVEIVALLTNTSLSTTVTILSLTTGPTMARAQATIRLILRLSKAQLTAKVTRFNGKLRYSGVGLLCRR